TPGRSCKVMPQGGHETHRTGAARPNLLQDSCRKTASWVQALAQPDITIEFYNEAGQLVIAYKVHRCWVSEFQALPDLDAGADAVALQHIKLENEGWERDTAIQEPVEPAFKG